MELADGALRRGPSALSTVLRLPPGSGLLAQSPSFAHQLASIKEGPSGAAGPLLRRTRSVGPVLATPATPPTIAEKSSQMVVEIDATRIKAERERALSSPPAR